MPFACCPKCGCQCAKQQLTYVPNPTAAAQPLIFKPVLANAGAAALAPLSIEWKVV